MHGSFTEYKALIVYSLNVSQWEIKFLWSALRFTITIMVVLQHHNVYKIKQKS